MSIETMKLALEALEDLGMKHYESTGEVLYKETFTALRQAIEQAQQAEPVACGYDETTGNCTNNPCCYTSPSPRQPLTDEHIAKEFYKFEAAGAWYQFARAIEAAHGIKE